MNIIFLDRDGVINTHPGDGEYVRSVRDFTLLPHTGAALKKLTDAGYMLCVISNQAGVAKGLYTSRELDRITRAMKDALEKDGVTLAGVFYCTHRSEENCTCRKPKAGLVLQAIAQLTSPDDPIDKSQSYFIGDTMRDIETAAVAGLTSILVFTGHEKQENKSSWTIQPDYTAENLREAADIILNKSQAV